MPDREMLKDKVAIVTGGRGGIGQAICQRFSQEGAIVYAADIQQGEQSLPANTSYIELDVGSEQSVASMGAMIEKAQGRADILVNAAGIEIEKTIEQTTLEEWNRFLPSTSPAPFSPAARYCR